MYLSCRGADFENNPSHYGLMIGYRLPGGYKSVLEGGGSWMLDNGAFSGQFEEGRWLKMMRKLSSHSETCIGVISPDSVFLDQNFNFVKGDWLGTLEKLHNYSPVIRAAGYRVAYALQDDHPATKIPWDEFDTLFIAGTSEWKVSAEVEKMAMMAKNKGKWVHIGRVNTKKRLLATWWADSWDGTHMKYAPAQGPILISQAIETAKSRWNQYKLV
jgi:hypothetical protein